MRKKRSLVIDIGSSHIKVFTAQISAGGLGIDHHGLVEAKGLQKGLICDVNALANAIRLAIECTGGPVHEEQTVIVGIGGMRMKSQFALGSIALKGGNVGQKELAQVRQAAVFSAPDDLKVLHTVVKSYRLDGCVYEGVPLGESGTSLELECSLITVEREQYELLEQALEIAAVHHVEQIVSNLFCVDQLLRFYVKPKSYLLVDMGAEVTDLLLYENDCLVRMLSLPVGGIYLTNDIMQGIEVDFSHAEKLKAYFGKLASSLKNQKIVLDCSDEFYQDKNVQYDFLYDIIDSRVEEIVDMLYNTVSIDLIDREIRTIYFTGGCAMLYNFVQHFERAFSMEIRPIEIGSVPRECLLPGNIAGYGLLHYAMHRLESSGEDENNGGEDYGDHSSLLCKIKKMLHF